VDHYEGPDEEKRRLKTVISMLAGGTSAEEACLSLGIERARLYEIVETAMTGALAALRPRPPGRPPRPTPSEESKAIVSLEAKVEDLEIALEAAEIREQLAIVFPWYRARREREKKRLAKRRRRL
jgi:transposase